MELKPSIQKILEKRYFTDNENTYDQLCRRVAEAIASAEETEEDKEKWEQLFHSLIYDRFFLPNTPTWINAGLDGGRTLSACFVRDIDDTMVDILEASKWTGMVQKFGGGTGFDLSSLRPAGTPISSTHGVACGPLRVLKYLMSTSQMITQGGARDGANMAVMDVNHKDVMDFITVKAKESKYLLETPMEVAQDKVNKGYWTMEEGQEYIEYCRQTGVFQLCNISIAVDERFMEIAKAYETSKQNVKNGIMPADSLSNPSYPFNEELPCGFTYAAVWDAIVQQAWQSGDPGLLFIDRAREAGKGHSPLPLNATNPCGEQYLPSHGSCNLGSIDLGKMVIDGQINWDLFELVIHHSVRFLDNVVEVNQHPVPEIAEVNKQERRIGLGVMGWADMLLKLGMSYDSDEAIELIDKVGKFFRDEAHKYSCYLATVKGSFPLYEQVQGNYASAGMPDRPRRNATVTTVAPTGTISIIGGCSSGIEPHFTACYEHQGMREHGGLGLVWASEVLEQIVEGHTEGLTTSQIPAEANSILRDLFNWRPANEVSIKYHIEHQARWQKYIDNSISKTLNMSNDASVADVAKTYIEAYNQGCKGSTIYRDGSKPFQVLNAPKTEPEEEELQEQAEAWVKDNPSPVNNPELRYEDKSNGFENGGEIQRPEIVSGYTRRVDTPDGKSYITVNESEGFPFEVFVTLGKAGGKGHAYAEALGRLTSLLLRTGCSPNRIVRELRGIASGNPIGFGPNRISSVPDALAYVLEQHSTVVSGILEESTGSFVEVKKNDSESAEVNTNITTSFEICPECGSDLVIEDGCSKCYSCGYSKCS